MSTRSTKLPRHLQSTSTASRGHGARAGHFGIIPDATSTSSSISLSTLQKKRKSVLEAVPTNLGAAAAVGRLGAEMARSSHGTYNGCLTGISNAGGGSGGDGDGSGEHISRKGRPQSHRTNNGCKARASTCTAVSRKSAAADVGASAPRRTGLPLNLVDGGYTVVVFDVETTGLQPERGRIIQLAAKVLGSRDPKHVFSSFVDPEGAVLSQRIRDLTGITPQVLAQNGARCFRQVWPRFASWLAAVARETGGRTAGRGGIVLAAHNASFDRSFLVKEVLRARFERSTIERAGVVAFIDTLAVLRNKETWRRSDEERGAWRPKTFSLGGLFKHIFGREMPGSHNALSDVRGLDLVLSSPGIKERWLHVANANPSCQKATFLPSEEPRAQATSANKKFSNKSQGGTGEKGGVGVVRGRGGEASDSRGRVEKRNPLSESRTRAKQWAKARATAANTKSSICSEGGPGEGTGMKGGRGREGASRVEGGREIRNPLHESRTRAKQWAKVHGYSGGLPET